MQKLIRNDPHAKPAAWHAQKHNMILPNDTTAELAI